jgi:hypothetical protein
MTRVARQGSGQSAIIWLYRGIERKGSILILGRFATSRRYDPCSARSRRSSARSRGRYTAHQTSNHDAFVGALFRRLVVRRFNDLPWPGESLTDNLRSLHLLIAPWQTSACMNRQPHHRSCVLSVAYSCREHIAVALAGTSPRRGPEDWVQGAAILPDGGAMKGRTHASKKRTAKARSARGSPMACGRHGSISASSTASVSASRFVARHAKRLPSS